MLTQGFLFVATFYNVLEQISTSG
uniref:BH4_AAA_HYDROXYL_2 domain-containing protein n=1 Tax=Haemonchus contortus TaxID=6289 RepID=A0A7I4YYS5_HAECO